jgi:hypothetical protein
MPRESGCDPKACSEAKSLEIQNGESRVNRKTSPMEGLNDNGEDTKVGYDIATAPSAVYEIA